jgi:hypothetical protein
MFEITTATNAKMIEVLVLSQKNRQPEENPGAKLTLEIAMPNHVLSYFDGHLKGFLFQKANGAATKQPALEGVDAISDMPSLTAIGQKIGVVHWDEELTGYTLTVELGLATKRSNLEIADCTLSGWKFNPKEGGTVMVKVDVERADVAEAAFGKLAKLKSTEISITLAPPEVAQEDLATPAPAKGKAKQQPAGALAH